MRICFTPLSESHFDKMLEWLQNRHVKKWWDKDVNWDQDLIKKKYESYVNRYKILHHNGEIIKKPIYPFIINADYKDIGYIQYYNRHDFPSKYEYDISKIPQNSAGIDFYIGEVDFVGQGLGSKILDEFLKKYVFANFDNALVDPEVENSRAIKAYEKAGFSIFDAVYSSKVIIMMKRKSA